MEWFFVALVYLGGIWGTPDDAGFFKHMFWPYYLGKKLGAVAFEPDASGSAKERKA